MRRPGPAGAVAISTCEGKAHQAEKPEEASLFHRLIVSAGSFCTGIAANFRRVLLWLLFAATAVAVLVQPAFPVCVSIDGGHFVHVKNCSSNITFSQLLEALLKSRAFRKLISADVLAKSEVFVLSTSSAPEAAAITPSSRRLNDLMGRVCPPGSAAAYIYVATTKAAPPATGFDVSRAPVNQLIEAGLQVTVHHYFERIQQKVPVTPTFEAFRSGAAAKFGMSEGRGRGSPGPRIFWCPPGWAPSPASRHDIVNQAGYNAFLAAWWSCGCAATVYIHPNCASAADSSPTEPSPPMKAKSADSTASRGGGSAKRQHALALPHNKATSRRTCS